ncbi:MAG: TonB-dependent receptor [Bacteroidetes bacterium]|nr:TonB-dependent receptor [Bacteroidota bacterium]
MKLTSALILFAALHVNAKVFSQTVSISGRNLTLLQVFSNIEQQTGYAFVYDEKIVRTTRPVTLEVKDVPLTQVLDLCLKNQGLIYHLRYHIVVITRTTAPTPTTPSPLPAAPDTAHSLSGRVLTEDNQPLAGVSVTIKGVTRGTITDPKGNFHLRNVDDDAVLVASYVGYIPEETPVGSRHDLVIHLKNAKKSMDDFIIVGYGSQRKTDVTGSVVSVNSKVIAESPVVSAAQALQGRVAGMDIVNNSGRPGDGTTIRIRGNRSITAGNDPLYVVDGIPMAGDINGLNPGDIESIQVLKDASATAIYGSRGANGVILVTTKTGRSGKPVLSYDGYYGVTNRIGTIDMMNARQYGAFESSFHALAPADSLSILNNPSTNYQDYIFRQGYAHNHSVAVRGGTDNTKYSISAGYYNEKGIVQKGDFSRYSLRINLSQKVNDHITVGTNSFYTYGQQDYGIISVDAYLATALQMFPWAKPYNADGTVNPMPDGKNHNPLADIRSATTDLRKTYRFFGTLYGEYEIWKGLKYRLNLGMDNNNLNNGSYNSSLSNNNGLATAGQNSSYDVNYTVENILRYNRTFGRHSLDLTGLYSLQHDATTSSNLSVTGVPYDSQLFYNLGSGTATGYGSRYSSWSILSYMGRLNYGYKGKYLATLTMRADGSSRLAPGKKWGYFPSAALAWRVVEEDFMKKQNLFSDFKVRASYGVTGNTGISPYATQGSLSQTLYNWYSTTAAYGYAPSALANSDLKWESTASTNLGIDFAILKNRLSGTVELYYQHTYDLLLSRAIPSYTGFSSVLQNIGKTRNKGYEVTLSAIPISSRSGFQWNIETNFYSDKEAIVSLTSSQTSDIGNGWFVGQPINVFYDYRKIGIWQTSEATAAAGYGAVPGDIKFADLNKNGKTDANDRMILGNPRPRITGGLTNRFSYKGFDLSFFIFFRQGQMIYSNASKTVSFFTNAYNNLNIPYWTPTNGSNAGPRGSTGGVTNLGSLYYYDGSYVRLQNLTLGYTLPGSALGKAFSSLRVYMTGQNLFSRMNHPIPGLKRINPEIAPQGGKLTGYLNLSNAIANDIISMGINAAF